MDSGTRPTAEPASGGGSEALSWARTRDYLISRLPQRFLAWVCWAAGLIILGGGLWLASRALAALSLVVLPCAIAVLLVALLEPLNAWLRRRHLSRGLAAILSVLALLAALAGVGLLAGFSLASRITDLISQFQGSIGQLEQRLLRSPLPISQQLINHLQDRAQSYLGSLEHNVGAILPEVTTATLHLVTGIALTAFLVIFILYDSRRIWRWVLSLLPTPAAARLNEAGRASWVALTGFVHGTFLIAVIHATVIGTTLYLLGVPAYLSLALLVFLGSFVPLIGAVVAGGFSVIFTLGTQGLVPALILLGVLLLENELEAHVLQPFVVGRYVRLHPVAIVLVLALGSVVGGLAGVLLAVPLVGAARAAWGPLNGRESVVPVGEPSRLSRLSRWLRRTWESVVRRSPDTSPRRTRR